MITFAKDKEPGSGLFVMGVCLVAAIVPETKGKTLEEIERIWIKY
jgi:hypothetical protein